MDLGVGWGGARGMTSPTPIYKIPARPPRFQMTSMITITKKQPQNQIAACVMGVIRCSKMGKNNQKRIGSPQREKASRNQTLLWTRDVDSRGWCAGHVLTYTDLHFPAKT